MTGPHHLGEELTAAITRRFPASTSTYSTVQPARPAEIGP